MKVIAMCLGVVERRKWVSCVSACLALSFSLVGLAPAHAHSSGLGSTAEPIGPTVEPATAWGFEGHRVVAQIALQELDAVTHVKLDALLQGEELWQVSTWPDEVRKQPEWEHTAPWHYINVPPGSTRIDLNRDGKAGQNVVSAIHRSLATVANRTASRVDRRNALAFLVHFVGDVHQPLHCSYGHDRGGNDVSVELDGGTTNLHRAWDTDLVLASTQGDWLDLAERLHAGAVASGLERMRSVRSPQVWAEESLHFTRGIYGELDSGSFPPGMVPVRVQSGFVIDFDYFDQHQAIVEQRLLAAGVRLAVLLEWALDDASWSLAGPV